MGVLRRLVDQPEKIHVFRATKRAYAALFCASVTVAAYAPNTWIRWTWAGLAGVWTIEWWHYRKLSRKVEIVAYIQDGKVEGLKVPSTPDEIEWGDDE